MKRSSPRRERRTARLEVRVEPSLYEALEIFRVALTIVHPEASVTLSDVVRGLLRTGVARELGEDAFGPWS